MRATVIFGTVLIGIWASIAAGCGKSGNARYEERERAFMAENAEALKAKAANLASVAADAASHARVVAPEPSTVDRLNFDPEGNAEVTQVESLSDGEGRLFFAFSMPKGLRGLRHLAKGDRTSSMELRDAVPLEYLLVVRIHDFTDPEERAGGVFSFRSGHVAGDALLYDLRTGAYVAGVPYEAGSSDSVSANMHDAGGAFRSDLGFNAEKAIAAAVASLAREVAPPGRR